MACLTNWIEHGFVLCQMVIYHHFNLSGSAEIRILKLIVKIMQQGRKKPTTDVKFVCYANAIIFCKPYTETMHLQYITTNYTFWL
ncbi:MAG: hypothetical protein M3Z26_10800 [Bacteroidota bacterium]|nr:hypothetical protein [Bacteroidota bacterium]